MTVHHTEHPGAVHMALREEEESYMLRVEVPRRPHPEAVVHMDLVAEHPADHETSYDSDPADRMHRDLLERRIVPAVALHIGLVEAGLLHTDPEAACIVVPEVDRMVLVEVLLPDSQ